MSKSLKALEKIVDTYCIDNMDKEINIIEKALKDYENLKKGKKPLSESSVAMKYILTENGKISDIEEFINEIKQNEYYKDYEFEPIKFIVGEPVEIRWTATGAKISPEAGQKGQYAASTDYPLVKAANTIEELCDVIVYNKELFYPLTSYDGRRHFNWKEVKRYSHNVCCSVDYKGNIEDLYFEIYGAIWTDKGLIYVAKMSDKGELKLL